MIEGIDPIYHRRYGDDDTNASLLLSNSSDTPTKIYTASVRPSSSSPSTWSI